MSSLARSAFLVGVTLVVAASALAMFGVFGLFVLGAVLTVGGGVASAVEYLGSDDNYRVECPDCGADNWAERTRCRECDGRLP
ncbi:MULTISPECIES: hypothetical protein [Halorussus]|uniref:hypothetical protein n=1 Tax=Halorussus TaxID=1070314 RepID=UPI00209DD494|nr:hypothetical protein [Halorussus vallis]USZ76831.1 hypothetical protein NGM07_05755 [Halorussus vallis]